MSMRFLTLISTLVIAGQTNAGDIAILPKKIKLTGSVSTHRLLVQKVSGDEHSQQLTDGLKFQSSNPKIVKVVDGVAVPVGDGNSTISVQVGNSKAACEVVVEGTKNSHRWSFRNHVQPVLAKMGCNSGACHGALAGKGGFKLSLRGYDPSRDHHTITRQARGRRIELSDPGRSLLLVKPSGAIPHKGGLRFDVNSPEYRVLSEWIGDGATAPRDDDPQLDRLEVLPESVVLGPGLKQQVLVRAHYTDGRIEDVTRWAKYTSANEAVSTIDDDGVLSVIGHGEGAITAWFSSKIVIARVTSPYPNQVPSKVFADADKDANNFIDELVVSKLKRLNLPPSPPATDQEFLRRTYLDTIGTLPKADEVRKFLADETHDKRDRLIDALLSRPEFVDYWTYRWSDVLMINGTLLRPEAVKAYYMWARGHVEKNTPWDAFVRELVTATGDTFENGATNFYSLHQDPENMSENVSQAFLGLSIGCAKCHNHPLEKWTNNQYYAMANMFARVRAKGWGGDSRSGDGRRTLYVAPSGELIQPLTGKPQIPTPLDGEPLPLDATEDRRIALAEWLTSAENPYFSRSVANRIWANFFRVGLVEPVDDMRTSNPASNEELLSAAADYLVQHKFNLKALMRAILRSKTYQRSGYSQEANAEEKRFYSHYYPRRLMAEVLLDAVSQVTAVPTEFNQILYPGADRKPTKFYPKGTRAIQLYDSAVDSYFLKTFGRNQRRITCECERTDEPSMIQVLHISNGNTINQKLASKEGSVEKLFNSTMGTDKIVEEIYLSALSRFPTKSESERLVKLLVETPDAEKRIVLEDVVWGVLSSREFLFNH